MAGFESPKDAQPFEAEDRGDACPTRHSGGPRLSRLIEPEFALEFTHSDQPSAYFLLEADRGTMPVTRPNLSRSSFQRKLFAYHATWKQGLHNIRFGFPRFRVLTVTTSAERLRSMIDACGKLDGGHGLFAFAEAKLLLKQTPFAESWRSSSSDQSMPLTSAKTDM